MSVETQIHLNKFKPRWYQLPLVDAIENKGYKRVLAIMPRRAGKDVTAFNIMIRASLKKVGVYYYIFPTYAQAKKVIWDSITNTGEKFLDYIPRQLIESSNSQEMKIRLVNGSLIQLVGSDNIDSLVGTNPRGIVFSEYALQDPRAYMFLRPILLANDGWALFISTPRGKNSLWELYNIAKESKDWFVLKLSVEDTQHISLHEIEKERAEGIMSDDLIQQEYYCSFEMGVEGAYYAKYLDRMRVNKQIGQVPWESGFKVHTAWDLGVRDSTTIIFFQTIGQTVRIINCYENSKFGLDHYVKVLQEKPYIYGKHIAPHDIKVTEFGTGMSRLERARQLGISFLVAPDLSIQDGIESVRSSLSKVWIDESCSGLIRALENYRQEYDSKKKIYKSHPLHDWSSHYCFTGDTLLLTSNGMRQIKDIQDNDKVLTLEGWRPCTKAVKTRKNAKLVEVSFGKSMKVRCTPDHLFLTTDGWISAKYLRRGMKIRSSLTNSLSTLMDHCIAYGRARVILLKEENGYIEPFGKLLLAMSQEIATYITETMIPLITTCGISNAFQLKTIEKFRDQIIKDSQLTLEIKLENGINQKRGVYGTNDLHSGVLDGPNGSVVQNSASTVNALLRALYEEMGMSKNFATQTVKHLTIGSVKCLKEREDVYDITVPGIGHFSLANGAIVHNSDCMRYLCISLPKTRDGASPADLEKRYMQAMYGESGSLPAVFRDDLPPY